MTKPVLIHPPRVLLLDEPRFEWARLSTLVQDVGARVTRLPEGPNAEAQGRLCLMVLTLDDSPATAARVEEGRRSVNAGLELPVLGVVSSERGLPGAGQIRRLAVVRLVQESAGPELVRFRLRQAIYTHFDRRRLRRVPCCLDLEVEAEGRRTRGLSTDLSALGIGFSCDRGLAAGTPVVLRFSLVPGAEPLEVSARVAHQTRCGRESEVGALFEGLDQAARRELLAYLAELGNGEPMGTGGPTLE